MGITAIKNDYVTNASLTSQLNNLKSQHIATEVTTIDNKAKKNASDILALEKGLSFNRGFFYYLQQSYLVYECKIDSFTFNNKKVLKWKSTGVFNYSDYYSMNGIKDTKNDMPKLKNEKETYVLLQGSHFQQNNVIIKSNNNVINIYCVYKLDPISTSRDDTFSLQNALFGATQITKNADTSRYKYKGYGICFDGDALFRVGNINNGRNVVIFGVHEDSVIHSNNIFLMGDGFMQGINDTTLYAEKMYSKNFTQPSIKFVLSLHYNGDNSYLFVNGKQELKFTAKKENLVKEKLYRGNVSDKWSTSESEKTGLYGNI